MQPFVVSLGDPAGVGPEVTARAWAARHDAALPPFFAVGDIASVRAVWDGPIAEIDGADQAHGAFGDALPIWHVEDSGELAPGTPTTEGAHCALHALELGVGLARSGGVAGLITAPVSKDQLYRVGFSHPGQTEFIADRCGVSLSNAIMMLAGPTLRVVPITGHMPLRDVAATLSVELIVARAQAAAKGITRCFGIAAPRLAMAGFNPHAGEAGALGREEIDVIIPAIEQLRAEGLDVTGPHSPDAMFTDDARAGYDAALCMYHDQALIPLKALHFDAGVNLTLGLPIVRTSPDHGTAFDIAGSGKASPGPMIAAIQMAASIAQCRADCSA